MIRSIRSAFLITRKSALIFLAVCSGSFSCTASAADTVFESQPTRTHLLELFTSEGCSSCPPAEAWLSKLKESPGLWKDFVPVAFHVDYWDHLGWRDPFANKAWTARQYAYSALWQSSSVYTPGSVLDGREWHNNGVPSAGRETSGILKVTLTNSENITINFRPVQENESSFDVHAARLGFGLSTKVKAGENSERNLSHDFVVLALVDQHLESYSAKLQLGAATATPGPDARVAIAVWITKTGQAEPIQALGGWLPGSN
jgi:hypothetical protein